MYIHSHEHARHKSRTICTLVSHTQKSHTYVYDWYASRSFTFTYPRTYCTRHVLPWSPPPPLSHAPPPHHSLSPPHHFHRVPFPAFPHVWNARVSFLGNRTSASSPLSLTPPLPSNCCESARTRSSLAPESWCNVHCGAGRAAQEEEGKAATRLLHQHWVARCPLQPPPLSESGIPKLLVYLIYLPSSPGKGREKGGDREEREQVK